MIWTRLSKFSLSRLLLPYRLLRIRKSSRTIAQQAAKQLKDPEKCVRVLQLSNSKQTTQLERPYHVISSFPIKRARSEGKSVARR
jgi:hypothetical protein